MYDGLKSMNLANMEDGDKEISHTREQSCVTDDTALASKRTLAWLQVAGSFALFFNSWGMVNTYGVFQTYYETKHLTSHVSSISWIGSTQSFLLLLIGAITGPLFDLGYFRALLLVGTFLLVLGLMMTSISAVYWQVLLAQGLCLGLGAGFLYIPSVAILTEHFTRNLPLAIGVASTGSCIGGVIYPIMFRQLERSIGFNWATRTLGFTALCTCSFAILVMRRGPQRKFNRKRSLLELAAFKERKYTLYCGAMIFAYIGFFTPIYYLPYYALQKTDISPQLAFYLVSILNAASIPGRIVPSLVATRIDPLTLMVPIAFISGILAVSWIGIHSISSIIAFTVLYGYFSGGLVSLPSVVVATLTPDSTRIGTRMGMCSILSSLGSLAGTPLAGACLHGSDYLGVQLLSGLSLLMCSALLLFARTLQNT